MEVKQTKLSDEEIAELVYSDGSQTDEEDATEKEATAGSSPVTKSYHDSDIDIDEKLLSQMAMNKKWVLKAHPDGKYSAQRDLELVSDAIDLSKVKDDEVVVKVHILAIDPSIRTMIDSNKDVGTIKINDSLKTTGIGKVVKGSAEFPKGSVVVGLMTAAHFAIVKNDILQEKVAFANPMASLGVLGSIGMAAYLGVFVVSSRSPKKDETVVVSAAAGSVGCLVSQMAKQSGAKVIGIAGGKNKKDFILGQLELHGAIDYMDSKKDLTQQLDEVCPDGIDFFFDSVGGEILDTVLNHINTKSRVVICGATSQYEKKNAIQGPSHYIKLAEKSASLHGLNSMDFPECAFKATTYLAWNYIRDNFAFPQHIEKGLESFAHSIEKLLLHEHCGQLLVQVSDKLQDDDLSGVGITKGDTTKVEDETGLSEKA